MTEIYEHGMIYKGYVNTAWYTRMTEIGEYGMKYLNCMKYYALCMLCVYMYDQAFIH